MLKIFKMKSFDPKVFNDPIATRLDWSPLLKGIRIGTNREIIESSTSLVLKVKKSEFTKLFFLLTFVSFFAVAIYQGVLEKAPGAYKYIAYLGGVVIFYAFYQSIISIRKKIELHSMTGQVIIGKDKYLISEVLGVQVVEEYIKKKKRSYYSYEINLVLNRDFKRINLAEIRDYEEARTVASQISSRLNISCWDMRRPKNSVRQTG